MKYTAKPAVERGSPGPIRAVAWCVHLLTASGAVLALLAMIAIDADRPQAAFGWIGLALVIDGLDGPLARRFRVRTVLRSIDGALLDNLVDYLTYVLVPGYLILRADLLPPGTELAAVGAVCVLSAFQFAHVEAKPNGEFFRGFPCYWNVVAFYLVQLELPHWAALSIVLSFCALIFVPILYVHPSRTRRLRPLTLILTALWVATLVVVWLREPTRSSGLIQASILYPLYYFGLSLALTFRRGKH